MLVKQENDSTLLRTFLAQLNDPARAPFDASRVVIVTAHPDDETVACGALLLRLRGAQLVVVTDGAPRDLADARTLGFDSADRYAAARRRELFNALSIVGLARSDVTELHLADQQSAYHLDRITPRLAGLFASRGTGIVLTHAYEGGHPDHDAVAFAVHCACSMRRSVGHRIDIIEMPLYRLGSSGEIRQSFCGDAGLEVVLTPAETALKRRMIACYETQRHTLEGFAVDIERYRCAPVYDFTQLPNDGRLLYERHSWNMDGARWQALVRSVDEIDASETT